MPSDPRFTPQEINQYTHDQMTTLLRANHIDELDSYGWKDAYNDIPDPDLIGHAMQQRDSFAWRFLLAAMDSPKPPELKPWEKALAISDGDFTGLMEAARLSIGLMLFQRDIVGEGTTPPSLSDSPPFL